MLPHGTLGTGADPGVVAQEVDGAVLLEHGVPQLLHRCVVGHVAGHSDGIQAVCPQFAHRIVQCPLVDVGQGHLHALAGEPLAHGPSDATGASGDHRHPAGEFRDHSEPTGDMSSYR
jgi:hypothetical protein